MINIELKLSSRLHNEISVGSNAEQIQLKYSREDLLAVRSRVYHSHMLNKLSDETVTTINKLYIHKRRKRGPGRSIKRGQIKQVKRKLICCTESKA